MKNYFDLTGQTALVTGGGGVLGGAMADALARAGAKVIVSGRRMELLTSAAQRIQSSGGAARAVQMDVTDEDSVRQAFESAGDIHILLNAAGGTNPKAMTSPTSSLFDLDLRAMQAVMDQNWIGTVIPSLTAARQFVDRGAGVIINIASMASYRPVTRNVAYSNAKSAVKNFTEWLAVHLAVNHSPRIRVNAIAPGFFVGEQNRHLLLNADGSRTPRGEMMVQGTPMRRFGEPEELGETAVFLASTASRFITGVTIPVDGGFQAFGGV
jgi:NAD(P)-dependent dehydrogenase (short-subunit alcohol dehydrogenase family)